MPVGRVTIEDITVVFGGTSQVTAVLTGHVKQPFISMTSVSGNQLSVNLFISALSTSSVTVNTSAPFTGTVHLRAISEALR